MAGVGDPVRAGFVFSLPYPGGNVTGTALLNPETVGKQLEMLKEAAPALKKVAILRQAAGDYWTARRRRSDMVLATLLAWPGQAATLLALHFSNTG